MVDARHQSRGEQQAHDDQRHADAVGRRARDVLEVAQIGRHHPDLERARLETLDDMPDAARQLRELVRLGREEREQRVGLEAVSELGRDDRERLLTD